MAQQTPNQSIGNEAKKRNIGSFEKENLWSENLVATRVGSFLEPRETWLAASRVCQHWRRDISGNDHLWFQYANRDFYSSIPRGPFGAQDGQVVGQRMSYFAFSSPYADDPQIWSKSAGAGETEAEWCLQSHPTAGFRKLYADFFKTHGEASGLEQRVKPKASRLSRKMVGRWKNWFRHWRYAFVASVVMLLLTQLGFASEVLDNRVIVFNANTTSPLRSSLGTLSWNILLPRPEPCEQDWRTCLPWTLVLAPTWMLAVVLLLPILAFGPLYCRKNKLRKKFAPVFRSHPTTNVLRKIVVAEFPHDRSNPSAPGRQPPAPPRFLRANLHQGNNFRGAVEMTVGDRHRATPNPNPPPPVPPVAHAPVVAVAPTAVATAAAAATIAGTAGLHPGAEQVSFGLSDGRLRGYRLLCKLVWAEFFLLGLLSFGMWADGWWQNTPVWVPTIWFYPCPLATLWILPRAERKTRELELILLTLFWYGAALILTIQLAGQFTYVGSWVFVAAAMPFSVIAIAGDPSCNRVSVEEAANRPQIEAANETCATVMMILSVGMYWVASITITGRIDAFMQFSWWIAAAPLAPAIILSAISSIMDPN